MDDTKRKEREFVEKCKRNIILKHVLIFGLIGLLIYMRFPCPFKMFFGVPCPACGTLHALGAIMSFNFDEYIRYNYLAVPMILVVWLGMHKSMLLKNNKIIDFLTYIVCILIIIRYFSEIYIDFFINR